MRALIPLLFVGYSFVSLADEVFLPSELLKNPEKYDGQHVSVKGYISIGPENRNLFDSKEVMTDWSSNACIGLDAPDKKFDRPRSKLYYEKYISKVSGVFRAKLCGPKEVCLFWCNNAGIELDSDVNLIEKKQ